MHGNSLRLVAEQTDHQDFSSIFTAAMLENVPAKATVLRWQKTLATSNFKAAP
jgi:hypothetical protein